MPGPFGQRVGDASPADSPKTSYSNVSLFYRLATRTPTAPDISTFSKIKRVTAPFASGLVLLSALLPALAGCDGEAIAKPPDPVQPDPVPEMPEIQIPAQGTGGTLDVATWNLLFFGAANQGPEDEPLQMARVRDVILGTDFDLWGVQEVTDADAFTALVEQLPGYGGFLASDTSVSGGSDSYHRAELKVGLVYKSAVAEVTGARIVLSDLDYEFAGRPPLEVGLRVTLGGTGRDVVVIVLHAKAIADETSWGRRRAAGEGLKEYLDTSWPDRPVLVVGDWNDDVDESITRGRDTPYRSLVDAAPEWVFPTASLSAAGARSMPRYTEVIDHILASDEAMAWYQDGSAMVYGVDEFIGNYLDTTSDHLPVLARFRPTG